MPCATVTQTLINQNLAFLRSCQSMPGSTASINSSANGIYWFSAYPWHTVVNDYSHNGPPNSVECQNPSEYFGAAG